MTLNLPAPHLGVSIHLWDPYFERGAKPKKLFLDHLDALAKIAGLAPNTISRVRFDVGWSASQPTKTAPSESNPYNERLWYSFEQLALRGLTAFPVIHQSPAWSRAADGDVKQFPDAPETISDWAQWFARTYRDHIHEIEVWNEPNLEAFTGAGKATPEKYVPLLKAFATAAREGHQRVKIAAPNVSSTDWAWVRSCYALGMKPYADIISVHPYQGKQSIPPKSVDVSGIDKKETGWERLRVTTGLPLLWSVMCDYGDSHKPIWNTEAGWSASPSGVGDAAPYPDRDTKAAAYLRDWLEMLTVGTDDHAAQDAYAQVALSTVYELYDPLSKDAHQKGFEIIRTDGTLKPQALALGAWRASRPVLRPLYGGL